ncbi:MAG: DUF2569 domain-containing protein [Pseudoxanthomonas mexicana]|nr:DUF2569 domain-containing protein [Pseudoxanthomonas mexicana]
MSENPYQAPVPPPVPANQYAGEPLVFRSTREERNRGPEGLGGWLILPMIGLALTVLKILGYFGNQVAPMVADGTYDLLTTPGSELYHPLWLPLLLLEGGGNGVLLVMALVAICLYFMRSRWFPRMHITFMLTNAVLLLVLFFFGAKIPALMEAHDVQAVSDMTRGLVGAAIWVPYMLTSKRVRNTFRPR